MVDRRKGVPRCSTTVRGPRSRRIVAEQLHRVRSNRPGDPPNLFLAWALVSSFEQRVIRRERLGVRRFQAEEFEIDELASFGEVRGRSRLQAKGRDARSPERSVDLHYPLLVHPHPVGNDSPHGSVDAGRILAAREKHEIGSRVAPMGAPVCVPAPFISRTPGKGASGKRTPDNESALVSLIAIPPVKVWAESSTPLCALDAITRSSKLLLGARLGATSREGGGSP
jgi:hypothetical protein